LYIFTGYIRFLNDRRQQVCSQNSDLPFSEITKVLATEWNQMPADKKQVIASWYIINYTVYRPSLKHTDINI